MGRIRRPLAGLLVAAASLASASSASAYGTNFGCSHEDRSIAATAYYTAPNGSQWFVDKINYSYSRSGGGHTNTSFRIYNGTNAVAWNWDTPDDRGNDSYSKNVDRYISRGQYARAWQKTWFDVFGNDPSCSKSGSF